MKKVFLFVAVAALSFSLNSCSSSSGGGSSLSFKVDGVSKSFKTFAEESGGMIYVTGYTGSAEDPTETLSFSLITGETGDVMDSASYVDASGDIYSSSAGTSDITVNNGSTAKGTFTGTLSSFDPANDDLTITDGKFSVSY